VGLSETETGTFVRALVGGRAVRLLLVDVRGPAEHTRRIHGLGPDATRLAADLSVATVLASAYIKGEEQLTWQLQGEAPRCSAYVDVTAQGHLRARASPADLHMARFQGLLLAVKHAPGGELYRGVTAVEGDSLERGIASHFGASDQVDVILRLGSALQPDGTVRSASGLLLERLPEEADQPSMTREEFSERYSWVRQADLSQLMLQAAFGSLGDEPIDLLERTDVTWKCRCSLGKIENTLSALDSATLDAMIDEDHGAVVTCNFCSTEYAVTEERLREIRTARASSRE
jgi:molecular chaperone Hsp33